MKLEQLIGSNKPLQVEGDICKEVTGIETDSRRVKEGTLFVAMRGTQTDGHAYIEKAIEAGASVIVCETLPPVTKEHVTYLKYEDTSTVVGPMATRYYGDPTKRMKLVGVTGTNGKTTIATLLYHLFRRMGFKCGLCSTVCNYIDGKAIAAECTTPDPITLNRLLGEMADEGCQFAFMEVSSHSVVQKRIGGLHFTGGIFTNLTRDHLDYHGTFENYRDAKKTFFDILPQNAFALTNADDRNGLTMLQNTKASRQTYSIRGGADFQAKILEESLEGMNLLMNGEEVYVRFVGRFNVSNLLAVYGAAVLLGADKRETLIHLSALQPVSGRFEAIRSLQGLTAIVDYAHTPDALCNVLDTIREILGKKGQCWTVCGAGGNRDKGKRPLMAKEAVKRSEHVILTSDNPRHENPEEIINDMWQGVEPEDQNKVLRITDRKEAIRTACTLARTGDVVLVAGKGHEDYQIIGDVKHHFDDHEVIREIFGIN